MTKIAKPKLLNLKWVLMIMFGFGFLLASFSYALPNWNSREEIVEEHFFQLGWSLRNGFPLADFDKVREGVRCRATINDSIERFCATHITATQQSVSTETLIDEVVKTYDYIVLKTFSEFCRQNSNPWEVSLPFAINYIFCATRKPCDITIITKNETIMNLYRSPMKLHYSPSYDSTLAVIRQATEWLWMNERDSVAAIILAKTGHNIEPLDFSSKQTCREASASSLEFWDDHRLHEVWKPVNLNFLYLNINLRQESSDIPASFWYILATIIQLQNLDNE